MGKYKEFAARLHYVMAIKGLRNKDIVRLYKEHNYIIHTSTVSQILNGRFPPTDNRTELLSEVLGVSKKWLQGEGRVEDMVERYNEKEVKDAAKGISKLFISLSPDSQELAVDFMYALARMDKVKGKIIPQDKRMIWKRKSLKESYFGIELQENLKSKKE